MPFPIPVTFFKAGTTTTTTTTTTTVAVKIIVGGINSSGTSRIQTSSNGTSWTSQNVNATMGCTPGQAATADIWGGVYAPALGLYVLGFGGGSVATSTTAAASSWTIRSTPFTDCVNGGWNNGLAWASSLSLFVMVSQRVANPITSTDGITWTSRTGAGTGWSELVWAASISTFVAIQNYGTGKVLTSTNGTSWTQRSVVGATTSFNGIAWSPTLALFAAVGSSGIVQTSPDGTTWTTRTPSSAAPWLDIAWSPTLGMFAACSDGNTAKVMTSTNGTTWTERLSLGSGTDLRQITWSTALGLFIIAGNGTNIYTSSNGTSWTLRTGINLAANLSIFANS